VTNAGAVTWFEFVQEIARQTGADLNRIEPIASADLDPPRPARRPANSVLDNAAWRSRGGAAMRPFEAALSELLAELG
jgi:dTDP-4-dehydrorhamnose reductase